MLNESIHYLAYSIDIAWTAVLMIVGFLVAAGAYIISAIAAVTVPAICLIIGALLALFVPYFIVVVCLELLNAITNGFIKKSDKSLIGIVLIGAIILIWFV